MSERIFARKTPTPIITTGEQLRKSVIELRGIYDDLETYDYCLWYEKRYGVKAKEVQKILESADYE